MDFAKLDRMYNDYVMNFTFDFGNMRGREFIEEYGKQRFYSQVKNQGHGQSDIPDQKGTSSSAPGPADDSDPDSAGG